MCIGVKKLRRGIGRQRFGGEVMKPERWARIKPSFMRGGQPAAERAAFIRFRCNGDESLAVRSIRCLLRMTRHALSLKLFTQKKRPQTSKTY